MSTRHSSPRRRRFVAALCLLCLSAFAVPAARAEVGVSLGGGTPEGLAAVSVVGSNGAWQEVRSVAPGEVVWREIGGRETHRYRVSLTEGQFVRFVIEQRGADVDIKVSGPGGATVAEMDSPNGLYGPESASLVVPATGEYVIEVPCGNSVPGGGYELRFETPRAPTAADRERLEAERLFNEGQAQRFKGGREAWTQAVGKYGAALAQWEAVGDVHGRAYTVGNMGRVYWALCETENAITHLEQAVSLFEAAGETRGEAWMLNEVGAVYRNSGDAARALERYERALALRRAAGDRWGEAQLLNNVGLTLANTGAHQQAAERYRQALELWRDVRDQANEANTLNNLALSQSEVGDLASAAAEFLRLIESYRAAKYVRLEAFAHNNLGKVYDSLAEPLKALEHYDAALAFFRNPQRPTEEEAMVLDNIGMVHAGLGDAARALEYFSRALDIRERLCSPRGRGVTLTNIGYAYVMLGEPEEALKRFEQALPLNRAAGNMTFVAYALLSQGIARAAKGDSAEALRLYREALDIQTGLGDRRGQALTLDRIGQMQAATGATARALDSYERALASWTAAGDRQGQALTLYNVARAERDRGNLNEALRRIEGAVGIVESLRTGLSGWQLQLNYFTTKQDFYELNVDVRMRLYRLTRSREHMEEALYAGERARARSLLELLAEARADLRRDVPPPLAERERSLEQSLGVLTRRLIRARGLGQEKEVAALEKSYESLTDELHDLQARIRAGSKSYADLKRPQPFRLAQIQRLLDEETVLLQYALGEKRSYVWAVTQTGAHGYELPGEAALTAAVDQLKAVMTVYESPRPGERAADYLARLRASARQYEAQSAALSRTLLGQVAPHLNVKRLVVVADGALLYLPFEALPSPAPRAAGAAPLVATHEIIYEPSATTLALLRDAPRGRASGSVAVLADPVFDAGDQRVKVSQDVKKTVELPRELERALRDVGETGGAGSVFKLKRLRHSAAEAEGVVAAAREGSWMKAVNFEASRATATGPALKDFGIVHFATHGILDDKHPELSGVVLSLVNESGQPEDGFLRLGDIYKLTLSADLVVLSACQTGLGQKVKGEGLVGLTRGFMHAGAARVVASLWRVDDEATAELMKRFYQHMLGGGMPPAAALRQAKLDLMKSRELWRAPYFWAGFVIQGDWK